VKKRSQKTAGVPNWTYNYGQKKRWEKKTMMTVPGQWGGEGGVGNTKGGKNGAKHPGKVLYKDAASHRWEKPTLGRRKTTNTPCKIQGRV